MSEPPVLLLASRRCSECLISPRRIVSSRKANSILRGCRISGQHFICHKGSIAGLNLHCRGVHDIAPSTAAHLAERFGIEIREVDPDNLGEVR